VARRELISPQEQTGLRRALGLRDLVLFNIVAVCSIRWLAVAAHTGAGSVTLWASAVVLFFVPSALVVAGLSRRYPEEGGLYVWTKEAFGPWHGFLSGAFYTLSVLFLLPSMLLSGLSIAAAAFGFGQDKWLMIALSLGILWGVLLCNLAGVAIGKWPSDLGGVATFVVVGLLMAAGGFVWLRGGPATRNPDFWPQWDWQKLNFWSQIALALTGLELGAIMAGEIRDPSRTIPRAAWIAAAAVSIFYIGGTLAVLALVPAERIDIMAGLVQAGQAAGATVGWKSFPAIVAFLVLLSAAGGFSSWLGGCARLPFVIGIDEYLPPAFARLHKRWGTPWVALLAIGGICTLFLVSLTAGETLRTGYQLLVDLTTITSLLPFLYLFAAGWKNGQRLGGACGFGVTALAVALAFIPPEGAGWTYEAKLLGGCAVSVWAARMNYKYALQKALLKRL
jgi:amino acid transporter